MTCLDLQNKFQIERENQANHIMNFPPKLASNSLPQHYDNGA